MSSHKRFEADRPEQDIAREAGIDLIVTGHKHEQKAAESRDDVGYH